MCGCSTLHSLFHVPKQQTEVSKCRRNVYRKRVNVSMRLSRRYPEHCTDDDTVDKTGVVMSGASLSVSLGPRHCVHRFSLSVCAPPHPLLSLSLRVFLSPSPHSVLNPSPCNVHPTREERSSLNVTSSKTKTRLKPTYSRSLTIILKSPHPFSLFPIQG